MFSQSCLIVFICRVNLFKWFSSHWWRHTRVLYFLFSPSDWIPFGNGTSFPRDSFVQQRGTPVKIFLKMRILASSFQWGVSQVLRGLRFRDNCVQSFQFFTSTLCHLWNHFFSISRMLSIYLRDKAISNILICSTYMTFLKCFWSLTIKETCIVYT